MYHIEDYSREKKTYFTLTQTGLLSFYALKCIHLMEGSLTVLLALFPYLCIHAHLPQPNSYCQLYSLDSITTAHVVVSSMRVVAITM